jgi:hypothetical protein
MKSQTITTSISNFNKFATIQRFQLCSPYLKKIYSKPTFATAIAMIYFFLVVSTHEVVGEIVVAIFRNSSRVFYQAYNLGNRAI